MAAEVTDSTKQTQAPEHHIAQQTMAADNQQGPSAAHVGDMSKASTADLVSQKVLPDTKIIGNNADNPMAAAHDGAQPMPPTDGGTDVLSTKDGNAIRAARAKGETIDENFYQKVSKSNAGLDDFKPQDGKADKSAGAAAHAVTDGKMDMTTGEAPGRTRGVNSTPESGDKAAGQPTDAKAATASGAQDKSRAEAGTDSSSRTSPNDASAAKPTDGPAKPADASAAKPTDGPAKPADTSAAKPTDDPAKPADTSAAKPTDGPAKPADTSAAKPTDGPAKPADTSAAKPTDTSPANLQHSDRLNEKPNGSGEVTVKPHDNLWRIASESLKQNHPEGYKPSNQEIQKAVTSIAKENHLSNPNMIRDGQKIKIPEGMIKHAPDGTKPQETGKPQEVAKPQEVGKPQEAGKPPEIGFESHNASPEFAAKVQAEFKSLPPSVQKLLADNGTKLQVGKTMSDADPSLKGVTPRGWSKGSTWDDEDGEYDTGKKTITIAEQSHDRQTDTWNGNDRMEGGLRHETGHAVDAAMGSVSHGDEFKKAYDSDVSKMSAADKQEFKYLLQNGHAGREETFAEVFGANNGSSANKDQTERILRDFPNVSALIARKQAALPNA